MSELEAARFVRAALDLIRDNVPQEFRDLVRHLDGWREEMAVAVSCLDAVAPPWEPEPAASTEIPWARVACGDSVQAPNGTWYAVDAVARIGERMRVHLLLDAARIESTPKASDPVPVRRGPAGQAMDIFTASGLELTLITSGVAA